LETGQEQASFQHEAPVLAVGFSTGGRRLATGSEDGIVRLWDLEGEAPGSEPRQLGSHRDSVNVVSFSPDGRWLATGSADATVHLWDLSETGSPAEPVILVVESAVASLAFSPDGRWLVMGGSDATTRIWSFATANLISSEVKSSEIRLDGHQDSVSALAFSPDSRWLVTGGYDRDRTVRLWPLQIDDLMELACQGAGGEPAAEDWQSVFPGRALPGACQRAR
jgi:WD40 repeat protein